MNFYFDSELKKKANLIHFGKVQSGLKKELELYLYNDNRKAHLEEIKITSKSDRVQVVSYPTLLKPEEKGLVKLVWSTSDMKKEALEDILELRAEEVYHPLMEDYIEKLSQMTRKELLQERERLKRELNEM